ncbi:Mannan endo-1,6-alpha-mannosidase DCW1-like protein 6 [Seiridium cupressi]
MHSSSLFGFLAFASAGLAALEVTLTLRVAYDLMSYYHGNESGQTPGILPGPPPDGDYYWWIGGALWGVMLDYWHYTGDDTYNAQVNQSLLHQTGPNRDFLEPNWTASTGNDDQSFWAMSALLAAEVNFPDPPKGQPQWLALAQAVWNEQANEDRRNSSLCVEPDPRARSCPRSLIVWTAAISNAAFLNIGARLARYTNNDTYIKWCEDTWDWFTEYEIIDDQYSVYDGIHWSFGPAPEYRLGCSSTNRAQFSYSAAALIQGAANLYNYTNGDTRWKDRLEGLVTQTLAYFAPDGFLVEPSCEFSDTCDTDMISFKGHVHRWLASASQLATFTAPLILPVLRTSTQAAVDHCTAGDNGRMCTFSWAPSAQKGPTGACQQMNVLGALSSLLVVEAKAPVTNTTGGTSIGDANAGPARLPLHPYLHTIDTGDRVGAAFVTVGLALGTLAIFLRMSWEEDSFDKRFSYGLRESYQLEDMASRKGKFMKRRRKG